MAAVAVEAARWRSTAGAWERVGHPRVAIQPATLGYIGSLTGDRRDGVGRARRPVRYCGGISVPLKICQASADFATRLRMMYAHSPRW